MASPQPGTTLKTLSRELGLYYEARLEELRGDYIADQVFPVQNVRLQAGTYKKIPMEEILRYNAELRRAPGAGYLRSVTQFTEASYVTYDRGKEEPIDDGESAAYSEFIDIAKVATGRALHDILADREARVAAALMDTSVFTGSLAQALGNGAWSSAASTPIADVRAAADKMFINSGYYPDTLVISRQTFRKLQEHADIIAQVTSSGAGDQARTRDITRQQMAQIFDVDQVLVGGGPSMGSAGTIGHIWPKHAMVCKVARSMDMSEPCIGRQFHWPGDGSSASGTVDVYRSEEIRSYVVRARIYDCEQRIHNEMGVMIANAIA